MGYLTLTDIEFNPQKSINCQAEALAIYVGLYRAGKLDYALENESNFLNTVFKIESFDNFVSGKDYSISLF